MGNWFWIFIFFLKWLDLVTLIVTAMFGHVLLIIRVFKSAWMWLWVDDNNVTLVFKIIIFLNIAKKGRESETESSYKEMHERLRDSDIVIIVEIWLIQFPWFFI